MRNSESLPNPRPGTKPSLLSGTLFAVALLMGCSEPGNDPGSESRSESRARLEASSEANPASAEGGGFSDYNVVVIVIDSLRAGELGAYGYARDTSPFLDSLATRSTMASVTQDSG